ncbi:PIG-L deacetylase family protein [Dethiosulfatarculus sandiegensis]|uniref:GlcNAc-PI de-N-acetylase n=1 Tax=Dethiosulfatarculus sandiegensis TaxID=1429043 RepID=A0A0D2HSK9_9BACT|nr:PIG-L deacetylase family protein [Dethiosulfatarculus sandiegensis]KIX13493.1 hypothetical protein X474_13490 [Dethiosulfatarculus sandiegensis]
MLNSQKVLVAVAHPNDEILGPGALCARLAQAGARVQSLILGQGLSARTGNHTKDDFKNLAASANQAARILGMKKPILGRFPDNSFDTVALLDIVKRVEEVKSEIKPDLVLTHHSGDLNIDHRLVNQAVLTAFRPLPGSSPCRIQAFEVPSSTEYQAPSHSQAFLPSTFVDISRTLELKLKALSAYEGELRKWPHPRSLKGVEHLAAWRGSQAGLAKAEAFMLLREVLV